MVPGSHRHQRRRVLLRAGASLAKRARWTRVGGVEVASRPPSPGRMGGWMDGGIDGGIVGWMDGGCAAFPNAE